jgi:nucleotide-binding universal stress UspA family protein
MKKFLFATDFSEASNNSFQYIESLIRGKDITLDIINVFDIPIAYSTQTPTRAVQGYIHERRKASKKRINERMEKLPLSNKGEIHSIYGIFASSEIVECAVLIQASMIIMSLRKDYGILNKFIGNTTARTIDKSKIPVLSIPAKATYKLIKDILFPTAIINNNDLSTRDKDGILWLSIFSGFLSHPNIELIHIMDDSENNEASAEIVNKHIDQLKITYSYASSVEEGICQYMAKNKPQLLAFYKPHRNFWERVYRPSKSRPLLYESKIPLLIFG